MLASTLLLLTYLFLIGAQDASNNISNESNTDSITVLKEESAIDNATRVLELTDLQFQEVLDKSANASSYVFAKVFILLNTCGSPLARKLNTQSNTPDAKHTRQQRSNTRTCNNTQIGNTHNPTRDT